MLFPAWIRIGYENTRCKWLCLASFKVPGPEAVLWAISSSLSLESSSEGMCSDRELDLKCSSQWGSLWLRSRYWGGFVIHIFIFCKGMTGSVQDTIMWSHTCTNYRITAINYDWSLDVSLCTVQYSTHVHVCMRWHEYCIVLYYNIYIYNTVSYIVSQR